MKTAKLLTLYFLAVNLLVIQSTIATTNSDCFEKPKFNNKQKSALAKIESLRTFDWLNKLLTNTRQEYELDILYSAELNRHLVLLGEFHSKGLRAARRGRHLLRTFHYRFFELVPHEESLALRYFGNMAKENTIMGVSAEEALKTMMVVTTGRLAPSTIQDAITKGLSFIPSLGTHILHQGYILRPPTSSFMNPINLPATTLAEGVLENYRLLKKTSLQWDYVNLPLDVGPYLEPHSGESYMLDKRNERMVENIIYYLSHLKEEEIPLAIVGGAHNKGMVELLTQRGFESCTMDF